MTIISLLINEDVLQAEAALENAGGENVLALAEAYLRLLNQYSDELNQLDGIPEINLAQQSKLGRELVEQSRKAVKAAIDGTAAEKARVSSLIESFYPQRLIRKIRPIAA